METQIAIKPGHYPRLSNEAYHADSAVSKSRLDVIARSSPAHYFDKFYAIDKEPDEPTEAKILGAALHVATFEPDLFPVQYGVLPTGIDRRTKEGKSEYAQLQVAMFGKIILTADQYRTMTCMAASVRHSDAWKIFEGGDYEEAYFVPDPETGTMIKAKPDSFKIRDGVVGDLKSTLDASEEAFGKSAGTYRYDVQGAWYPHVMKACTGDEVQSFAFVAVEKTRPFAVGVYYLGVEDFAAALKEAKHDLRLITDCLATGLWPDYAAAPKELKLPPWYRNRRKGN